MCSSTCSGCHSLSDCTFLYKYGYETVTSDVVYKVTYDENNDIGTTYLGTSKMRKHDEWKAEHKTPIMQDC